MIRHFPVDIWWTSWMQTVVIWPSTYPTIPRTTTIITYGANVVMPIWNDTAVEIITCGRSQIISPRVTRRGNNSASPWYQLWNQWLKTEIHGCTKARGYFTWDISSFDMTNEQLTRQISHSTQFRSFLRNPICVVPQKAAWLPNHVIFLWY